LKIKSIVIAASLISSVNTHLLAAEEWPTGVTVTGLVQIEARYNQDYDEVDASDFIVDELGVGIEAQVHKWATAQIVFLYEEGATPLEIDEAIITLGNLEASPVYLSTGQLYVPFGNFESNMISDPLTLELAEAREKALQLGFEAGGAYGSIYGFNGSTQDDARDTIDHYGAQIGFAMETGPASFDLGIGYISDISDSDGLTDALGGEDNVPYLVDYDYVNGLAAHLIVNAAGVNLIGEYVMALDTFKMDHLAFNGNGAEPKAWNVELGYTFKLANKEMTFALGYQGTEEALALGLPETRYLGGLSMGIFQNTTLSLEYAFDEDYAQSEGGTGEDATQVILQLAVEF